MHAGCCGGKCYRVLTEILLAGGDFPSDRSLLADPVTQVLRRRNALPPAPTLWQVVGIMALRAAKRSSPGDRLLACEVSRPMGGREGWVPQRSG
jgi:hypothetical protein